MEEEFTDRRPIRDKLENATDSIPKGPLGKVGEGNLAGAAGYLAVESGEIVAIPVPGATRPGFKYVSHSLVETQDNTQRYNIVVHAISKDVAEFAVQYKAAPSNVDFLTSDLEMVSTEMVNEKPTYSTYRITVDNYNANKWVSE